MARPIYLAQKLFNHNIQCVSREKKPDGVSLTRRRLSFFVKSSRRSEEGCDVRSSGDNSWCSDGVATDDRDKLVALMLSIYQDIWGTLEWFSKICSVWYRY